MALKRASVCLPLPPLIIKNSATNKYGTGFGVEHKSKEYLVTARHMVEGLPTTKTTIDFFQKDGWKTLPTVKMLFPKSDEVDIAVLRLAEPVDKQFGVVSDGGNGVVLGQPLWFLGYPYQLGNQSAFDSTWTWGTPFVKRGTMSAIDAHDPNAIVIYIDGFNNPGFSGGPIVYWDFSQHKYKILGVVKGFKEDSAKVLISGQHMDTQLLVNSGILVAYSIAHADEVIEADDKP